MIFKINIFFESHDVWNIWHTFSMSLKDTTDIFRSNFRIFNYLPCNTKTTDASD